MRPRGIDTVAMATRAFLYRDTDTGIHLNTRSTRRAAWCFSTPIARVPAPPHFFPSALNPSRRPSFLAHPPRSSRAPRTLLAGLFVLGPYDFLSTPSPPTLTLPPAPLSFVYICIWRGGGEVNLSSFFFCIIICVVCCYAFFFFSGSHGLLLSY